MRSPKVVTTVVNTQEANRQANKVHKIQSGTPSLARQLYIIAVQWKSFHFFVLFSSIASIPKSDGLCISTGGGFIGCGKLEFVPEKGGGNGHLFHSFCCELRSSINLY